MTSAPVTASMKTFFPGQTAAGTSAGAGVENSFSDVLKNQKSSGETKEPESTPRTRVDGRNDKVSQSNTRTEKDSLKADSTEEISPEEAVAQAEKAAEAVVGEMVTQTAAELGITEEEVYQILDELAMEPAELLDVESLQKVVLTAAGEPDVSSFVTDEQLFTAFKNLTGTLQEAVQEVADATGLSIQEVQDIFQNLQEQVQIQPQETVVSEVTVEIENEAEPQVQKTEPLGTEKTETAVQTGGTTEDGSQIMLERSLEQGKAAAGDEKGFSGETAQNPFSQNLFSRNLTETVQTVQEVQSYVDTDTEMILHQITDYMKSQITDGVSELEMQLHPESLGNLHVRLTAKEGVVTAQFTTQNDVVKTALESQMIQLKETFKEQGISVEAIEVTVESHRFEENLSQNSGGNLYDQDRQPQKQRNRRINLNEPLAEEEFLTQEDRLAAEMLKENGGTVDYTA